METKDPWGDGEDPATSHAIPVAKPSASPLNIRLCAQEPRKCIVPSPLPSLQSICLGVLALHLEELVECGEDVLPHLPSDAKASLIAAARRRLELTDAALRLLVDPDHVSLTVRGVAPRVTNAGILAAAQKMARSLRYIDLRGVPLRSRFLAQLAEACSQIEVLWFGEWSGQDEEELGDALMGVLPRLEAPSEALADDWEAAAEAAEASVSGRFMRLSCVVWPEIPHETKRLCEAAAPAVTINPTPAEAAGRRLPACCLADVELDAEALAGVAGQEAWGLEGEDRGAGAPPAPPLHIAERFRLAFESQEKRLQKRDRRLWRKATRESLQSSGGERAIREWEYGF